VTRGRAGTLAGILLALGCTALGACSRAGTAVGASATSPGTSGRVGAQADLQASQAPTGPASSTRAKPGRSASPTAASPDAAAAGAPLVLAAGSLRGKTIAIDPGHNGANYLHPAQINRLVAVGNGTKACDTTGTETNAGYSEAAFTFDVSTRLAALLRAAGATVVLTRADNHGVGPCITQRAAIGNAAHADAAISIHGDGAPATGLGFHVIVPLGIGSNDAIVTPSRRLGVQVRNAFRAGTGESYSNYTGTTTGALVARNDLGGLNLSTVPKIFIECGNMRNATDARRMTSAAWRERAAEALARGLAAYLTS
jgi:N-acetylmuramoyl-L-alanine amidase